MTSDFPHEEIKHGGGRLTFNWIKHLSRSHELSLLSFIREEEKPLLSASRRYFREIRTVPAYRGWRSRFRRLPLLLSLPYSVVANYSPEMVRHLKDLLSRHSFDLVQLEYFHMGQYARHLPESVRRALVLTDVVSPVLRQQVRMASGLKKYYYYQEWRRSRYWEKWYAIWAKNVFVLSLKDKRVVESWDVGVDSYLLPPLLDEQLFEIPEGEGQTGTILFIGAMHRPVNQDAARRLKRKILPLVAREYPEARCFVVGNNPPPWLMRLSDKNFIVTGAVDRIEPYLLQSSVLVAPLRVAGGIIVKILEAMAAARPVVTSRAANAGIGAEEDEEIVVADREEDFAQKVSALLRDPFRARRIGEAARRFIRRRFDPAFSRRAIDRIYEKLVKERD